MATFFNFTKPLLFLVLLLLQLSECFIVSKHKTYDIYKSQKLHLNDEAIQASSAINVLRDFPLSSGIAGAVAAFGLAKVFLYSKMQYITAKTISGIPRGSKVVDLDVQDGKNIFYLSESCDYTAIMQNTETDPIKKKEKSSFNERVILESIGKANV